MTLRLLDLFSGIGGFSLGLERSGGFNTVAFCEIKPFCRQVLAKHWPEVPCYEDIRSLSADVLRRDGISVDVICGGFPCQDVSLAGARKGLDGERSGLWSEYARLIGDIRPRFVIVENTPGLLSLGMETVLGDLAALRYDAEWHCIPARAVGADHIRDRVWIVAYPNEQGLQVHDERRRQPRAPEMGAHASDAHSEGQLQRRGNVQDERRRAWNGSSPNVANSDGSRSPLGPKFGDLGARIRLAVESADDFPGEHWNHKPVLGRRLHGVSNRLDRVESLGNSVVPQIPEAIGRAIISSLCDCQHPDTTKDGFAAVSMYCPIHGDNDAPTITTSFPREIAATSEIASAQAVGDAS